MLFAAYAGMYSCRVTLVVAAPLLIVDLHSRGMSVKDATLELGTLFSLGSLAYAFGKFFLSGIGDFFGGKRSLLLAMVGVIACTLLFASAIGPPILLLAWIGNRLLQSIGWPGLVKVSANWFSYTSYGGVMAILSLSFLVGDAITRLGMSAFIGIGFGWRALFFVGAAALIVIFLLNLFLLKDSRTAVGFAPPEVSPLNVFGESGSNERPSSIHALLQPLLSSTAFWIVCALSFGTTLLRETFNTWTPVYFASSGGFSIAQAVAYSAALPVAGIVSVLAAGWLSDRLGAGARARIAFVGLTLAACAIGGLALVPKGAGALTVALVLAVGFFNTGPYSYLAGAMALDFGGRKGGALTAGIIDGVGYLGGALAGVAVARIELQFGWGKAFISLAALTACTALGAAVLASLEKSAQRQNVVL